MTRNTNKQTKTAEKIVATENKVVSEGKAPEVEKYQIIIDQAKANKLSPKTLDCIFFQVARNIDDDKIYLKMTGNEGGGLHSKEWLALNNIIDILTNQQSEKHFKSSVLRPVFVGKSSNNAAFLAAVLRSETIGLIRCSDSSKFLHVLTGDMQEKGDALLKLTAKNSVSETNHAKDTPKQKP
jgi:hypothetical protein